MTVAKTLLEAEQLFTITLAEACHKGDLLGYSSGWYLADADAATPIPALVIAMEDGAAADIIGVTKYASIYDTDEALTAGGELYLSGTAGDVTATAPTAAAYLVQKVGIALGADNYLVDLSAGSTQRYQRAWIPFPLQFATMSTVAVDLVTAFTPGVRGKIENLALIVSTVGQLANATATINCEIGTVDCTGAMALVLASTTVLGAVVQTAITGNNAFTAGDTISIEIATGGTGFTAGAGTLLLRIRTEDQLS